MIVDDHGDAPGLTVVCVFNNRAVREECLDRSLAPHLESGDVEYIPVDNTEHAYSSAGAALNHGAALARHDVVVFVHQDVFLHSVDALVEAASHLRDETWGVVGANGITAAGESVGRMRDRLEIIGVSAVVPVAVDSLDEVLFMVRRDRIVAHPLTEDPDLAWHAYAVEYGLRMQRLGLGVGAIDLACTHNSLTINLARLDVAHRRIAALYPERVPISTTCGVVGPKSSTWRDAPVVRDHRWRLRWLKNSARARQARRHLRLPVVLSDIRHDAELLDFSEYSALNVMNLDATGTFAAVARGPLDLSRNGRRFVFWTAATVDEVVAQVSALSPSTSTLVSGLLPEDLARLAGRLPDGGGWLMGVHDSSLWLLGGPAASELPSQWREPRSTPWGSASAARRHTARA